MNTCKRLSLILGVSFLFSSGYAAYLENVPQKITQPDGTIIHCFASGDEFHNWLHDSAGFTIIQHPQTGYYVYAELSGEDLVASQHVVGKINPANVGLRPKMNISPQAWTAKRDAFFEHAPPVEKQHKAATKKVGHINNIVIFIRFSDQTGFTLPFDSIEEMHNDSSSWDANSMYNYYRTVSYKNLYITSHFFPAPDSNIILSYQDYFPRSYYSPKSATNPNGYNDGQLYSRRSALLTNAVAFLSDSCTIPSLNFDYNNDGNVDNVTFVVAGYPDGWGELLWPHRSVLSGNMSINGKRVRDYNLLLERRIEPGVISHEMFHTLGSPDLYRYNYNGTPVGVWDLMANTLTTPQGLSAYMKYEYSGWIYSIPQITKSGTYTLYPTNGNSPEKTAYRIYPDPWYHGDEFLVLEYRNTASNVFENGLPGSGIVIYRINESFSGNAGHDGKNSFDEVYVFRPGGTTTADGTLSQAHFSAGVGRTKFGLYANPSPFYTRGGAINNVQITNITAAGDSIQFTVGFDELPTVGPNPFIVDCKFDYRDSIFIGANANETWTISDIPSWIQILPRDTIGTGSKAVRLRVVEAYNEKVPRTATLRVRSNSFDEKLTIIQCPCGDDCTWMAIDIQEANQNAEIKIFPNPAKSQFTVTNVKDANLQLYNILGQEILHTYSSEENTVININSLPQGIYVLKVLKNNTSSVHKIVVRD